MGEDTFLIKNHPTNLPPLIISNAKGYKQILYTMENSNGLRRLTIRQLFFILRHNLKLSSVRNPMFESNQFSKVFTFIGSAFILIYFVGIGTAIGAAAGGAHPEVIFGLLGLLLPMDFGMRFGEIGRASCRERV